MRVNELKKSKFKGVSKTLHANLPADVQKLLSKGRNPSRPQFLRHQQHQAMARAGEKLGIPKGPIVDTAATTAVICGRDLKYVTNVKLLPKPIQVGGSAGQSEVTKTADLQVGSMHIKDALVMPKAPESVIPPQVLIEGGGTYVQSERGAVSLW